MVQQAPQTLFGYWQVFGNQALLKFRNARTKVRKRDTIQLRDDIHTLSSKLEQEEANWMVMIKAKEEECKRLIELGIKTYHLNFGCFWQRIGVEKEQSDRGEIARRVDALTYEIFSGSSPSFGSDRKTISSLNTLLDKASRAYRKTRYIPNFLLLPGRLIARAASWIDSQYEDITLEICPTI